MEQMEDRDPKTTGGKWPDGEAAAPAVAGDERSVTDDNRPSDAGETLLSPEEIDRLTEEIVAAIKTVYDPEIPADIYELGLIYTIDINDDRLVTIEMTLTAPGCPVAGDMPGWVQDAVNGVPGVMDTNVRLTFDPPWDPSRMSDEARLAVGML